VVLDDWTDAMIETSRMRGSTSDSMTSRVHGELSERKRPIGTEASHRNEFALFHDDSEFPLLDLSEQLLKIRI